MKQAASNQKLRGGYYTPPSMARFLAEWAVEAPTDRVLEPSCGDGILLLAAAARLRALGGSHEGIRDQLVGIELDSEEAEIAQSHVVRSLNGSGFQTVNDDFFAWAEPRLGADAGFDVVVGNPPFIRFQNFQEPYRNRAITLMTRAGLKPSRMMNSWMPFLVVATLLLRNGGRLAMVVPAELLQVNYAAEIRRFLAQNFGDVTLVTFDRLVFAGIQQEVVLLLGKRESAGPHRIRVVSISDEAELAASPEVVLCNAEQKPLLSEDEKWTKYFLSGPEIELLREVRLNESMVPSSTYYSVDVGVVTGENSFFAPSKDVIERFNLHAHCKRLVSKAAQLPDLTYCEEDWCAHYNAGLRASLLVIDGEQLGYGLRRYIDTGEAAGYHTGYKCRIRQPWYSVPSVWIPDAFMLRQVSGHPKLVLNLADATCTDTLHRIRFTGAATPEATTVGFLNSATLAFSEVTGRSYGGGVMTFEPSEAERLVMPSLQNVEIDLASANQLLANDGIDALLDVVDRQTLEQLGISKQDTLRLRAVWRKLSQRRSTRKAGRSRNTIPRI